MEKKIRLHERRIKMNKLTGFVKKHLDFKLYGVTVLAFIVALLIVPMIVYINPYSKIAYENGLLENIQMVVLFGGCWFAMKSKTDKKFFYFVTMVLGILILREVNCGRTLFFPIPGVENAYYSWKDIKYGYLAHPLFGLYIAWTAIYFLKNKLFLNLWNYLKNTKLPVWNIVLMFAGAGLGMYAEHATDNFVFEEITELLFYTALIGIIWLYTKNKNFMPNSD